MAEQLTATSNEFLPAVGAGTNILSGSREFSLMCKDTLQGIISGLMMIAGSSQVFFTDVAAYATQLPELLNSSMLESLMVGKGAGGIMLVAAVLLFFSAKRSIARTVGVAGLFGFLTLQNMGVNGGDFLVGLSEGLRVVAGAIDVAASQVAASQIGA